MKDKPFSFLVILAPLLITGCYSIQYHDPIKTKEEILNNTSKLENYIGNEMRLYSVEKVSIAIVSEDRIVYKNAFNAGIDEQFQAASISKSLVSYAALQLVEKGVLEIDKPLSLYLKEPYFEKDALGNKITLRMILNHTSGMSNDTSGKDRSIYVEPGKEFHYSGGAFEYLRYIIEQITNTPFDEYMEANILKPLGMDHSTFYFMSKGKKYVSAAGGLVSTPEEICLFFIELMNPAHIKPETVELMFTNLKQRDEHNAWGLGIGVQRNKNDLVVWHTGNNGNIWESLAYFDINTRTGVVIMTKGKYGYKICQDIIHYAIGGSYYGLPSESR